MSDMASQFTGISTACSTDGVQAHINQTSKRRVTAFVKGLPSQRASNAAYVFICWRQYVYIVLPPMAVGAQTTKYVTWQYMKK